MTEIVENSDTTDGQTEQPRLISTIFRCYRENFGLFWRIMIPLIIFSLLFESGTTLSDSFFGSEDLWQFDTARGLFVNKDPRSTGVNWGMTFGFHSFSIGLLWLTMCPLTFTIIQRRRDMEVTVRDVWRRTRRKTGSILGASFLLYLLGIGGLLPFLFLTLKIIPNIPDSPYGSSLCLGLFLIVGVVIYFGVNWSLYNQSIIMEDRMAIAALRRSSELIRGAWGRAFGMYLLLALVTMVFTSVLLGLTLLVFSLTVSEFAMLREVLLSAKFFTLFFGGYARISFENAPSFWTVAVIIMVNTLVHTLLAPVWAILTTHLYMERTGNCLHVNKSEPVG